MKKNSMTVLFFLSCAVALSSCNGIAKRDNVYSAGGVPDDKVIIVGRVEFDPPMTNKSQKLLSNEEYRNLITFICDEVLQPIYEDNIRPNSLVFEGSIEALHGEPFYALSDRVPFYFIAGLLYKNIYETSCGYRCIKVNYEYLLFPGSFHINIKPGDKAVYIGTIVYERDNFFTVKRVIIRDDYDKEMPKFRRTFGNIKLRKDLIREPAVDAVFSIGAPYL